MATKKQKYYLFNTDSQDANEFDTREEVIEWLEDDDTLKDELEKAGYGTDHNYRLFKGVEVEIEAESESVKVKLTDCVCD